MSIREAGAYPPLTEAELDAWEQQAAGADDGPVEEILRLVDEVRRLRRALAAAASTLPVATQGEIVRDPERCGGAPTLAGTRTGVHDVASYAQLFGGDLERVRDEALPHLTLEQVYAAMEFYAAHTDEIEEILRQRREFYERGLAEARSHR